MGYDDELSDDMYDGAVPRQHRKNRESRSMAEDSHRRSSSSRKKHRTERSPDDDTISYNRPSSSRSLESRNSHRHESRRRRRGHSSSKSNSKINVDDDIDDEDLARTNSSHREKNKKKTKRKSTTRLSSRRRSRSRSRRDRSLDTDRNRSKSRSRSPSRQGHYLHDDVTDSEDESVYDNGSRRSSRDRSRRRRRYGRQSSNKLLCRSSTHSSRSSRHSQRDESCDSYNDDNSYRRAKEMNSSSSSSNNKSKRIKRQNGYGDDDDYSPSRDDVSRHHNRKRYVDCDENSDCDDDRRHRDRRRKHYDRQKSHSRRYDTSSRSIHSERMDDYEQDSSYDRKRKSSSRKTTHDFSTTQSVSTGATSITEPSSKKSQGCSIASETQVDDVDIETGMLNSTSATDDDNVVLPNNHVYFDNRSCVGTLALCDAIQTVGSQNDWPKYGKVICRCILNQVGMDMKFFDSITSTDEITRLGDLYSRLRPFYLAERYMKKKANVRDAYFHVPSHPGTQAFVRAVQQQIIKGGVSQTFNKTVFSEIKERLYDSKFFVGLPPSCVQASYQELYEIVEKSFVRQIKRRKYVLKWRKAKPIPGTILCPSLMKKVRSFFRRRLVVPLVNCCCPENSRGQRYCVAVMTCWYRSTKCWRYDPKTKTTVWERINADYTIKYWDGCTTSWPLLMLAGLLLFVVVALIVQLIIKSILFIFV